eukprot:2471868-Rhodomonas_salina.2
MLGPGEEVIVGYGSVKVQLGDVSDEAEVPNRATSELCALSFDILTSSMLCHPSCLRSCALATNEHTRSRCRVWC